MYLGEEALDLRLDFKCDAAKLYVVFVAQSAFVNTLYQALAVLKTGANLVWQPGSDWRTARRSRVLRVVDDVLFGHNPVLVSEAVGSVDVLQHQQRGLSVFGAKLFKVSLFVLVAAPVNMCLVI